MTVEDETYCVLAELSKNLKRTIPETLNSIITGKKFMFGILFNAENVCLSCGKIVDYSDVRSTDQCPFCKGGPIITRYMKVETRGS